MVCKLRIWPLVGKHVHAGLPYCNDEGSHPQINGPPIVGKWLDLFPNRVTIPVTMTLTMRLDEWVLGGYLPPFVILSEILATHHSPHITLQKFTITAAVIQPTVSAMLTD
jgi:hypothetical protein